MTRRGDYSSSTEIAARIMERILPEPNCGCWLWTGDKSGKMGYGRLMYQGRTRAAHRVAYQIFRGPITDGLLVCHRCDVPLCVNPDHLFLGTYTDNSDDMIRKGRARHNPPRPAVEEGRGDG